MRAKSFPQMLWKTLWIKWVKGPLTRLFEISLDIFLPICAGFLLLAMVGCDNGNVPGNVSFDAAIR